MEKTGNFSNLKFKKGVKDGLPIGLGYFPVAFAFGVQASILGVPFLITLLISMTNLTSAGQLAGLNVIVRQDAFINLLAEMLLTQILINSRYFLMSLTLTQKTDDTFTLPNRLLTSAFITDEIFAVAVSNPQKISKNYYLGVAVLPYVGWTLGTLFGALAGDILPSIITNALGVALYAMFIAIIIPPALKSVGVVLAILISAGVSYLFYFLPVLSENVSQGFAIIISALVGAGIVAYFFPIKNVEDKQSE